MSVTSKHLWFALRLVDLPWQALREPQLGTPTLPEHNSPAAKQAAATVSEKQRVIWANKPAISMGVTLNMDTTTAQLLSGGSDKIRQPMLEHKLLTALRTAVYQFTPYIQLHIGACSAQSGLLLEVSSCLKLFHGVEALHQKMHTYLKQFSLNIQWGLAHTEQGAWLLSFTPYNIKTYDIKNYDNNSAHTIGQFKQRLNALPLKLLMDYPEQVEALDKTGFISLGDITKHIEVQTISSIKKRFGPKFANYIGQIFGIEHNTKQSSLFTAQPEAYIPTDFFRQNIQLEYPLSNIDLLHAPIHNLLQRLADYLRNKQLQCQTIQWILADIYHNKECLNIYSDHSQTDTETFFRLTLIHLENRALSFAIDTITLSCKGALPAQYHTEHLPWDAHIKPKHSFTLTEAKLKARLGPGCMYKLSYKDSHLPEQSNQPIATNQACNQVLPSPHTYGLRPSWLLKKPQPITQNKPGAQGLHWHGPLQLLAGPERIQGNWWHTPHARDYFLAQRNDGVRLWIYCDLHHNHWWVQGIFS